VERKKEMLLRAQGTAPGFDFDFQGIMDERNDGKNKGRK
jgi:hypothetical protein